MTVHVVAGHLGRSVQLAHLHRVSAVIGAAQQAVGAVLFGGFPAATLAGRSVGRGDRRSAIAAGQQRLTGRADRVRAIVAIVAGRRRLLLLLLALGSFKAIAPVHDDGHRDDDAE